MEQHEQSAPATNVTSGVVTVRPVALDAQQSQQALPYFVGVSAATCGSRGICMERLVIPPGGAARPHIHQDFETAIYVLSGEVETRFGDGLRESCVNSAGDFVYIAPGVPHQPRNLSQSEPAIAIIARNDASDQEHVIPYTLPEE
ncbi:MAG TPA: cupin domain-containing protein [Ktedonobacterales bacterium]